jgi:hypothetical protein
MSQHELRIQMNPIYDFKGQVALVTGAAKAGPGRSLPLCYGYAARPRAS